MSQWHGSAVGRVCRGHSFGLGEAGLESTQPAPSCPQLQLNQLQQGRRPFFPPIMASEPGAEIRGRPTEGTRVHRPSAHLSAPVILASDWPLVLLLCP